MTGFGRASGENQWLRFEVVIRTLNHRHFDITLRLPEEMREHESGLRKLAGESLKRGRAEIRIDLFYLNREEPQFQVEEGAVRALRSMIDDFAAKGLMDSELRLADLLKVPGAVRALPSTTEFGAEDVALLNQTVSQALERVVTARQTEGRNLRAVLVGLRDELDRVVTAVETDWQSATEGLPERLRAKIEEMLEGNAGLDEARLAQEIAILAERGDVREELDRLRSHLEHFGGLLKKEGQALGKRLDFLAQEIYRELTTLAAKFRDPGAVRRVIDGKLVCEQIREQVQNIE